MLLVVAALLAVALVFGAGFVMSGSVRASVVLCRDWFGVLALILGSGALIGWVLTLF